MATFLYDPELGKLIQELKGHVESGKMNYNDALDVLKKAIKNSIKNKAVEYSSKENN